MYCYHGIFYRSSLLRAFALTDLFACLHYQASLKDAVVVADDYSYC